MKPNHHPAIDDICANLTPSELHGIDAIPSAITDIYSIGISTAGTAEICMAAQDPERRIIATTIDSAGLNLSRRKIAEAGLAGRIQARFEDVSHDLPYEDGRFDYVYARLVLHYLDRQRLRFALGSIQRILRPQGLLYAVVRSDDCPDFLSPGAQYDEATGMTSYIVNEDQPGQRHVQQRFFHTRASISAAIEMDGFEITRISQYDEQLYADFGRTILSDNVDNVIEVLARKI